ncbi:unnamed protein product, partial [Ostreobium quekettii]
MCRPQVKVSMVACGGLHTIALTVDKKLFSWGIHDDGALGRPTPDSDLWTSAEKEDAVAENLPGRMALTEGGRVKSVTAGGGSHTLALMEDGRVLGCGSFRGDSGSLGFSPGTPRQRTLVTVIHGSIRKISSGENHCLALTTGGQVLTWGCGERGALARGGEQLTPAPALSPEGVLTGVEGVFAGQQNTFVTTGDGKVYGWGLNNQGQLGLPPCDPVERATEISALSKLGGIKDAAGGSHHSLVLAKEGGLYSFGSPTYGVLGRPDMNVRGINAEPLHEPALVHVGEDEDGGLPPGARILAVFAGQTVSQCFVEGHGVYAWGASSEMVLGLGPEVDEVYLPNRVRNANCF